MAAGSLPGERKGGAPPKAIRARERDTRARDEEMTEYVGPADDEMYGPPLPEGVLPNGEEWHPQTVSVWNALRRHPIMQDEGALAWEFLIDTALMHHTMWTKGRWEFAGEVRLRFAKFGATPEDRMRLKAKVSTPTEKKSAQPEGEGRVTAASERRRNLRIAE